VTEAATTTEEAYYIDLSQEDNVTLYTGDETGLLKYQAIDI
jgi:hypothetical protein